MQTGADGVNGFGPWRSLLNPFTSSNGTLAGFSNQSTLSLSGGVLADIGPLSTAAVVTDGTWGWLAIAGSGGVAVLTDALGRGWNAQTGLQTHFGGLSQSMGFKKISNARNVRKIVAQANNLYVLTNESVERLTVTANTLATDTFVSTTLAHLTDEQKKQSNSFSDLIVSGPLALLATSFGLLRSGNTVDIQTINEESLVFWTPVELPESVGSITAQGPVSRLFAITQTGQETALSLGGMLLVLNAYVGLSEALVYRFAIDVSSGIVGENSVRLLPDLFIKGVPTFFANIGDYRNYVGTDGALFSVSRSAFAGKNPLIEFVSPTLKSGQPLGARKRYTLVPLGAGGLKSHAINKLLRDSASGSWMVSGDFGIRIQQ